MKAMNEPDFIELQELKEVFHAYHAGFRDALESPIFFARPKFADYLKEYRPELVEYWNEDLHNEFAELIKEDKLL